MSDSPGKNRASRLVAQPSDDQRPATDEGELAMKIVLISGTGLIGSKSVAILRQGGHGDRRLTESRRQCDYRRWAERSRGRRPRGD